MARIICGLLVVQQALDCGFTALGVSRDGSKAEGNPLIRFLIESYGLWSLFALKAAIIIILLLAIKPLQRQMMQCNYFRYSLYTSFCGVFGLYSVVLVAWFNILTSS